MTAATSRPGLEVAASMLAVYSVTETRLLIALMLADDEALAVDRLRTELFGKRRVSTHLVAMHISRIRVKNAGYGVVFADGKYKLVRR